jgi:hypothetical protein
VLRQPGPLQGHREGEVLVAKDHEPLPWMLELPVGLCCTQLCADGCLTARLYVSVSHYAVPFCASYLSVPLFVSVSLLFTLFVPIYGAKPTRSGKQCCELSWLSYRRIPVPRVLLGSGCDSRVLAWL